MALPTKNRIDSNLRPLSRLSSGPGRIGWRAGYVAIGAATAIIPLTNDPWLSLTLRAIGVSIAVLGLLGHRVRLVSGSLVALSLLTFAPSLVGEVSSRGALLALALGTTLALANILVRRTDRFLGRPSIVIAPLAILLYWLFVYLQGTAGVARSLLEYYAAIAIAALLLSFDRAAVVSALKIFAGSIAVLGFSAVIMLPVLFFAPQIGRALDYSESARVGFVYFEWSPLVITSGYGSLGFVRLSQLGGEPGTWALLAAMGVAAASVTFAGRLRFWTVLGSVAAFIASQSTGAWLSAVFALIVTGVALLFGGRLTVWRGIALVVLLGAAVPVGSALVDEKVQQNVASLTERGIGQVVGAGATTGDQVRINLLSAMSVDGPLLILLPIAGIAIFIALSRRQVLVATFGVYLGVMVLVVQPSTMHPAMWLGMALLARASILDERRDEEGVPDPTANGEGPRGLEPRAPDQLEHHRRQPVLVEAVHP